jgi:hypothetical protein
MVKVAFFAFLEICFSFVMSFALALIGMSNAGAGQYQGSVKGQVGECGATCEDARPNIAQWSPSPTLTPSLSMVGPVKITFADSSRNFVGGLAEMERSAFDGPASGSWNFRSGALLTFTCSALISFRKSTLRQSGIESSDRKTKDTLEPELELKSCVPDEPEQSVTPPSTQQKQNRK